jgi:hypothetical protein
MIIGVSNRGITLRRRRMRAVVTGRFRPDDHVVALEAVRAGAPTMTAVVPMEHG